MIVIPDNFDLCKLTPEDRAAYERIREVAGVNMPLWDFSRPDGRPAALPLTFSDMEAAAQFLDDCAPLTRLVATMAVAWWFDTYKRIGVSVE